MTLFKSLLAAAVQPMSLVKSIFEPILKLKLKFRLNFLFNKHILTMLALISINGLVQTVYAQNSGLQAMRAFVAQQKSISGDFIQTVQGKNTRQTGHFAMSKPAQFRWAIQQPFEQLLISDGNTLTQWDADLNQATQRSAEGLLTNTPAALLLGGAAVSNQFDLKDIGAKEGLDWVQATPKNTEGQFKSIQLGFKKGVPAVLIAHDAFGGISRIELNHVNTQAIDASQFRFIAPKGAEIVKM